MLLLSSTPPKFFDILYLSNIEASTVVNHRKTIFIWCCIPKEIISDGTQFMLSEYKQFSMNRDFKHKTSSPRYLKSNSLIEQTILTVKWH